MALLVAAVQKVREVANRTACAHNLRQIAMAVQHYDASFGALPPNFAEDLSRNDGSHNLFYGPFVRLLPFLEQDDVYKNFSFLYYDSLFPDPQSIGWPNVPGGMTWSQHCWMRNPFNRPPVQTIGVVLPPDPMSCPNPTGSTNVAGQTWGAQGDLRIFACPSRPFEHLAGGRGTAINVALIGTPGVDMPKGNPFSDPAMGFANCLDSSGTGPGCTLFGITYPPGEYTTGPSDYVAVVGTFIDSSFTNIPLTPQIAKKYHGLFNYQTNAALSRIPDGTTNTLLLSEFCGRMTTNQSLDQLNGWTSASWAANGVSSVFGTCPDPNNDMANGGYCDYQTSLGGGFTLGGWHTGLFNVAFADGSVRAIRTTIDRSLLLSLTGYNDGDVIGPDF
jgi:prepilin-type processing-associated H-X9-DG protein